MDRGLYVAATGMLAEMNRQSLLANNLANINTPGYKADRSQLQEFASVLLANRQTGETIGTMSTGPVHTQSTSLSQGSLQETGSPLDLAIEGDGFFAVQTDQGVRYTRNGRLTVNPEGQLSDSQGRPVLTAQGQPIRITGSPEDLTVTADGRVTIAGRPAGTLAVVTLNAPEKLGNGDLWNGQAANQPGGQVKQGAIEGSTTDVTQTMVDMTLSQRSFDASQRVLRAIDESLQRAAQIGQIQ